MNLPIVITIVLGMRVIAAPTQTMMLFNIIHLSFPYLAKLPELIAPKAAPNEQTVVITVDHVVKVFYSII